MIKKYAEMFNIDPSHFPISMGKRASADLYYWVKQMFTQEEHAFTLTNWRDFMAMKVRDSDALKQQLVNNLFSFFRHNAFDVALDFIKLFVPDFDLLVLCHSIVYLLL